MSIESHHSAITVEVELPMHLGVGQGGLLSPMSPMSPMTPMTPMSAEDGPNYHGHVHYPAKDKEVAPPTKPETKPDGSDPNKVTWEPGDDDPQTWSVVRKWSLTALCVLMTLNVSIGSAAPSAAAGYISAQFDKPAEDGYLVTSCFLFGYVFGPLVWGPGSEMAGRRPVFLISLGCYALLHLGTALAPNIQTLLVSRFLQGFFAVAPLTNCGGVIADIWDPVTRGIASSLFVAGVYIGPILGPAIGGFLAESYLGWRWIFWIPMMFGGVCTVIAFFFMPETYAPVLLVKKAKKLRKADPVANKDIYAAHEKLDWTFNGVMERTLYRPVIMLALEPILVLVTVYMSLVYGILYSLFESLPLIFMGKHGFSDGLSGLVFIGVGIGSTSGALLFAYTGLRYRELLVTWRGFPPPEERLWCAMLGGPVLVVGCFWLGWTGNYPSIPWIVPALATIPIGFGVILVFISFIAYILEAYLMFAASALAANTIVRSAVAAGFPLFTNQMFNNLGINWACTLIGLISLLLAPMPFLFYKYGRRIRKLSKFSPSPDLKIAEQLEAERAAATVAATPADSADTEKKALPMEEGRIRHISADLSMSVRTSSHRSEEAR